MTTIDLQDAYFAIKINKNYKNFLRFKFEDTLRIYLFTLRFVYGSFHFHENYEASRTLSKISRLPISNQLIIS